MIGRAPAALRSLGQRWRRFMATDPARAQKEREIARAIVVTRAPSRRRGLLYGHRPPQTRGQAMVEFALVVPVLFAVIFAFIVLSLFTVDKSVLDHAAVSGTRAGNEAMVALNSKITAPANLMVLTPYPFTDHSKPYGPYPNGSGGGCLKTRNEADYRIAGGQVYNANTDVLGWDWTCGALSNGNLAAPLTSAAQASYDVLRGLLVTDTGAITISACYADRSGDCVAKVTLSAASRSGGSSVSGLQFVKGNLQTEPAPSFIRVDIAVTVISAGISLQNQLIAPPSLSMHAHAVEVLDRFLPACPAPVSGAPRPGSCGSIY